MGCVMARRLSLGLLGLPAVLLAANDARAETVIRYAPAGDLRVLDPIWTSAAITVTHAQLVYDVLVTMDSTLKPRLQMAESVETSPDGMHWTFVLRPGLAFHDGTPVKARDVVLSILRWAKRVSTGQVMMTRVASIDALDDRTLRISLRRPFNLVMEVLATPVLAPFVMREQEATTDAFHQVKTVIGSGPFVWDPSSHQPGHRAVYRRNAAYVPRAEPSDGYAGGKVVKVDTIEWRYLPDPSTVTQALQKGEVDIIDAPPSDLLPLLRANKAVTVGVLNTAGVIGTIRPNSLIPPFNDPRARQALQLLMDQPMYNAAIAGDAIHARECHAVFVCDTPYATDVGAGPWRHANLEKAKALLAESGYRGEPIVLLDPADQADIHTLALVTADQLRRIGANVAVQTMDWSTVLTRRNVRESPGSNPNGWHLAFTFWGGLSLSSPISNAPLISRCDGKNLYGWPCDPTLDRLMTEDFLDATSPAAKMIAVEAIQARFYEVFPYIATGMIHRPIAHRANLKGLPRTQYPVFWNVSRD